MIKHNMNQPRKSLGVVGLGGLGHLAVNIGKTFGLKVTVFSTSISKKDEALDLLGANKFIISSGNFQTNNFNEIIAQPEREAKSPILDPARKLNMIKRISSSVTRPSKTMDRKEIRGSAANTGATSNHQPSNKRLTVTIPKESNLRTGHTPKSCAKQVV